MNHDEIMAMAREAGFRTGQINLSNGPPVPFIAPASGTNCMVELERFAALVAAKDVARLDWLESQINTHGAIHLHDGQHPNGMGLGLRPGRAARTLREAIDEAMKGDSNGFKT